MKRAVVLLSGGLDSTTTLFWAKNKGYKTYCLIFDYGQRHRREITSAKEIARYAGCKYQVIKISLPWKGSSLLDKKISIPQSANAAFGRHPAKGGGWQTGGAPAKAGRANVIPSTYVPARNTIFLSFALSYAEAIGADSIFIGANAVDFSGYPDCRPGYFKIFNQLALVATKKGVIGKKIKIFTPLIYKTKTAIVRAALNLGVPLELTWSCYAGGKKPCGACDSCVLRKKGFLALQMEDPAYA
ncbi:MAG: 7-cyano-7-deazaguanine synthase QueC [Candidatus Omnitrophota bacterium]